MGLELYKQAPEARAVFDQADEILGFALSQLCFEGPEADLVDTANQQPAIFTTSLAVLAWMQQEGYAPPDFVAGHSLGEFSALVAAGAVSFADGLRLVQKRGQLMKAAGSQAPGAMTAVLGLDTAVVQQLCQEASHGRVLQIANDNCPGQLVLSGEVDAIEEVMQLAQAAGARKVVRLPISIAAHSPLMASVADQFAQAVDDTPIQPAQCPLIGNVDARPLLAADDLRAELKQQLTAGVSWTHSMHYLLDQGVDTFVEVGPGDTLLSFIKRINRQAKRIKP